MLAWKVLDDDAALDPELREAWDGLAVASGRPFCAPGWLLPWWRHARPAGGRLRVVLVFDGPRLAGVAPYFVSRRAGIRAWRPLAAGLCQRVEPLAVAGREPDVARAVAAAAAADGPDAVTFEGIPASSPWPGLLRDAWPGTGHPWLHRGQRMTALTIDLAGQDFEAWFMSKTSHFRQRLRKNRREFAERGGVTRIADEWTVDRDLVAFAALHRARWATRAAPSPVTPEVERMLREAATRLPAGDRLRVLSLDVGSETIASSVLLGAGRELAYWLNGFHPREAAISPSRISILTVVEDAFALGAQRLDLGAGVFDYKQRFADGEETLEWAWLVAPGPRARLIRTVRRARTEWQRRDERVPAAARERLTRLAERARARRPPRHRPPSAPR